MPATAFPDSPPNSRPARMPPWTAWRQRQRARRARKLSFTTEGRIAVGVALAVGVAAINTGNNLMYLLLGWLLAFIIASGVLSELAMKQLRVTRNAPAVVYAGEPFVMELLVHNDKKRGASYALEVEDLYGQQLVDKRCFFLKVPPQSQQAASYRHSIATRGVYTLTHVRISTRFPFSLFRKSRDLPATTEITVLPAKVAAPRAGVKHTLQGLTATNALGRSGDFLALRDYRAGDSWRDIAWRATARTGKLRVREFEDERARELTIVVDHALPDDVRQAVADGLATPAEHAQAFAVERALALALALAQQQLAAGWRVALTARGQHVPFGVGPAHGMRLARTLALLPPTGPDTPFAGGQARTATVLFAAGNITAARPAVQHVVTT